MDVRFCECRRKETDVGIQAVVAYAEMGRVDGYGPFLCRRRQCIVNGLAGWTMGFGICEQRLFGKTTGEKMRLEGLLCVSDM